MKCTTLAELVAAYRKGEVTAPLMIDNDNMSVYDEATDTYVLEMHPYDVMEQALDLLGIPHESV